MRYGLKFGESKKFQDHRDEILLRYLNFDAKPPIIFTLLVQQGEIEHAIRIYHVGSKFPIELLHVPSSPLALV